MKDLGSRRLAASLAGVLGLSLTELAAAQAGAPEPPPPMEPWYDALDLRAFADAYGSFNYNTPKPQSRGNDATRAYDVTNGFALAWVGVDASYEADPVGGAVGLRWGPSAELYSGACFSGGATPCDGDIGLQFLKQAYASWRPGGPESVFTLDFGKFDTIYGAELAESQDNMNYTRGVVYWWAQPAFHTGLRANVEITPELGLTALAVNGYNNTVDNNAGKTFGLQLALVPSDSFGAYLGWLGGPEQDDAVIVSCDPGEAYDESVGGCAPSTGAAGGDEVVDRGGANDFDAWRHLIDLVINFDATDDLSFVLNGDLVFEGVRSIDPATLETDVDNQMLYGAMLSARYQLDETWAIAGRGEYFADPDGLAGFGSEGFSLATGTLTLEAAPTENLVLRLEQRGDFALGSDVDGGEDIFPKNERGLESQMITTTLGVVVTTN